MSSHVTTIDISNIPDLIQIIKEMKDAKEPRILKQGSAPVAMLMPMESSIHQHKTIDAFDLKPLVEVKAAFVDAGYPEAEVNDMIEAMSELPQYADRGLKKSQ